MLNEFEYDLVVIGTGPAAQKCAIAAAKTRKRVAIVDRAGMLGGVCVHTGTIPSKTIREAIFQLAGFTVKTYEDRPALEATLKQLNQIQTQLMMQVLNK